MELDYNSFINGLLNNPSTTNDDRERIVNLLLKERDKGFVTEERVKELIEQLSTPNKGLSNKDFQKSDPFIPLNPLYTANFFSLFNNPMGLKYLTHNFDSIDDGRPHSIEELISQINTIYDFQDKQLPKSLRVLVNYYITGKGKWTDTFGNSHETNINQQEWINWSKQFNQHPINNPEFSKEIMVFRSTVRNVPPLLQTIVAGLLKGFPQLNIKLSKKLEVADFYTNTYILRNAIRRIFEMMNNRAKSFPNVNVDFLRTLDDEGKMLRTISITQEGSFGEKTVEDAMTRMNTNPEAGDFGTIRSMLNGYCIWQVETKWNDYACRWNILKTEDMPEIEPLDNNQVTGFTHKLTYYIV